MSSLVNIVLGAGIAGISAAYHLKEAGLEYKIYEKSTSPGGLCSSFSIENFTFDHAIHLSFTKSRYVQNLFSKSIDSNIDRDPEIVNFAHPSWIKHPAQSNLRSLPVSQRLKYLMSLSTAKIGSSKCPRNYQEWLDASYGKIFSKDFPSKYTKKYWTIEPSNMETKWLGPRMHVPKLKEAVHGAFFPHKDSKYYAKELRYPKSNGYQTYLKSMLSNISIEIGKEALEIDPCLKSVTFHDGKTEYYENLFSSLPLPILVSLIKDCPEDVKESAKKLLNTSMTLVSLGIKGQIKKDFFWSYIYDEDIETSRVYCPHRKSTLNVPSSNYSSLQFEIYHSKHKRLKHSQDALLNKTIKDFSTRCDILDPENIVVSDVRNVQFANVVFDIDTRKHRDVVRSYLKECNIVGIGRFGEWEYFWSDQSLLSGRKRVMETIN